LAEKHQGINIGTVSGGIVNFGGAIYISPISITKTISSTSDSGQESTGASTLTNSIASLAGAMSGSNPAGQNQ